MRKANNLPTSCAVVTKSGNLNFLEPSGPLWACNGNVSLCFIFYTFQHHKKLATVNEEQLMFYFIFLSAFISFFDVSDDYLRKGLNMQHTC